MELIEYDFDIVYRPGEQNVAADALSRVLSLSCCSVNDSDEKYDIEFLVQSVHHNFGHPGISRLTKYLERKYHVKNVGKIVKTCIENCAICAKMKPRFTKVPTGTLIRSSSSWQRLSIDFMGPKLSATKNKYIFTVIDEYSRFPFAFPIDKPTAAAAIQCLNSLFTLFGPPSSIHSDRGSQFESAEFKNFLKRWNITKTRTTPFHPSGNGQCERFNGIIWKTVQLRLCQENLSADKWESQLSYSLMNIRSLPSRALDFESPHERFLAFYRRSTLEGAFDIIQPKNDVNFPAWMSPGASAYLKTNAMNHLMKGKDTLKEVIIIRVLSPYHARVRYLDTDREDTVSTRYLARKPEPEVREIGNEIDQKESDEQPSLEAAEPATETVNDMNCDAEVSIESVIETVNDMNCDAEESIEPENREISETSRPKRSARMPHFLKGFVFH